MGHFRKNLLTVFMTENCSLACRYCYLNEVRPEKPKSIDVNFVKQGIIDFFKDNSPAIRFFGNGEPTLEFKKMQDIWEYADIAAGGNLYSELQTNGFFNDTVCDWIIEHIDMIWVSCDGFPEVQNIHRPTIIGGESAEVVERNIRKLAGAGKRVGVRATIGNLNVNRQEEMIDYFVSLGVKAVFGDHLCMPVSGEACKGEKDILVEVGPLEYAEAFVRARTYADTKGLFYSNFLMVNFDEAVSINCRSSLPAPHLTPSGYVSSCDMVSGPTNTPLDDLVYGQYDEAKNRITYDESKIEKIRTRRWDQIPECQACEIVKYCAGGCAGEAINESGDFYGVKKNLCGATRYLASIYGVGYKERFTYIHP